MRRRVRTYTLQIYKPVIESVSAANLIFNSAYVQLKRLEYLKLSSIELFTSTNMQKKTRDVVRGSPQYNQLAIHRQSMLGYMANHQFV